MLLFLNAITWIIVCLQPASLTTVERLEAKLHSTHPQLHHKITNLSVAHALQQATALCALSFTFCSFY